MHAHTRAATHMHVSMHEHTHTDTHTHTDKHTDTHTQTQTQFVYPGHKHTAGLVLVWMFYPAAISVPAQTGCEINSLED